jgi:protein required for attachment to host cells
MQHATYLLVADSGSAKCFRLSKATNKLELVHAEANPAGRLTRSELDADRPGSQMSGGGGFHSLGGDDSTHRHESVEFARGLSKYLHSEHTIGNFDSLLIAAPPRFLGELRQHLSKDCQAILQKTVNKDLLKVDEKALLAHFE